MTSMVTAAPPDASWPFVLTVTALLLLLLIAASAASGGRRRP